MLKYYKRRHINYTDWAKIFIVLSWLSLDLIQETPKLNQASSDLMQETLQKLFICYFKFFNCKQIRGPLSKNRLVKC